MSDSLVIIPTYNEKENIEKILQTVLSLPQSFDILVVDDGSPDGTAGLVKGIQKNNDTVFLLERSGKLGLGTAYIEGFDFALSNGYDYIFEMDADFSHNPYDLIKLRTALVEKHDVAVGSRYVSGVNVVNWPMHRVLMSFFASKYVKFITGLDVNDATAGFVGYRSIVLKTLNLKKIKFIGYAFQIEMKFNSWKHGFSIGEVPIIFTDRTLGQSKMSMGIFKEALFGVMQLKIMSYFKKYQPAK